MFFLSDLSNFWKKKCNKSKFSWLAQWFKQLSLKFSPIWVSKKRNNKESIICFILTIDRTIKFDQSGPGSDGNEEVLSFPQSSSINGTSLSFCLMSFPGHLVMVGSYPSIKKQSVYFTAPVEIYLFYSYL